MLSCPFDRSQFGPSKPLAYPPLPYGRATLFLSFGRASFPIARASRATSDRGTNSTLNPTRDMLSILI